MKKTFAVSTVVCLFISSIASGDILTSGQVSASPPGHPSTWTSSTTGWIGKTRDGTMDITNGSEVTDLSGNIGYISTATGQATVNGANSKWTNSYLNVGYEGSGTLNVINGGTVQSGFLKIGKESGSSGMVTVDGNGSVMWSTSQRIGDFGSGTMVIVNGGYVGTTGSRYIGYESGSTGEVVVDGVGSKWLGNTTMDIGQDGHGKLTIRNGGQVSNSGAFIGGVSSSKGDVIVDGLGSKWTNNLICIGSSTSSAPGSGTLSITNGGLVKTNGLVIDEYNYNGSFINMSSGGMLALDGDSDNSLADFLDQINGTDAICYWNDSIMSWDNITNATYGLDYTLEYMTEGGLSGYTVLTVTPVPEPATVALLALGGLALRRKR